MGIAMYFDALTALLFGMVCVGVITYLRLKKKKSFIYLLFFTLFSMYLFKVLDYTLFQFQSLLLLKHFMPNLMLRGQEAGESIHLIPLIALTYQDMETSFLNILLFVPFGFGLPLITDFHMKKVVVMGVFFSIVIEIFQLVTGIMGGITFRIADINDVIFNTLGVIIGYIFFVGIVRVCLRRKLSKNAFLRYITERPQVDNKLRKNF